MLPPRPRRSGPRTCGSATMAIKRATRSLARWLRTTASECRGAGPRGSRVCGGMGWGPFLPPARTRASSQAHARMLASGFARGPRLPRPLHTLPTGNPVRPRARELRAMEANVEGEEAAALQQLPLPAAAAASGSALPALPVWTLPAPPAGPRPAIVICHSLPTNWVMPEPIGNGADQCPPDATAHGYVYLVGRTMTETDRCVGGAGQGEALGGPVPCGPRATSPADSCTHRTRALPHWPGVSHSRGAATTHAGPTCAPLAHARTNERPMLAASPCYPCPRLAQAAAGLCAALQRHERGVGAVRVGGRRVCRERR